VDVIAKSGFELKRLLIRLPRFHLASLASCLKPEKEIYILSFQLLTSEKKDGISLVLPLPPRLPEVTRLRRSRPRLLLLFFPLPSSLSLFLSLSSSPPMATTVMQRALVRRPRCVAPSAAATQT
jgi:hypothetical protein